MVIHSNGGLIDEKDLPPGVVIHDPDDGNETKEEGSEDTGSTEKRERDPQKGASQFLKVGEKFVNIEKLDIDLIAQINPFQGAYEILSKSVNAPMLKTIQDIVVSNRSGMTEEEAVLLWPNIEEFVKEFGARPSIMSNDPYEKRLAEALAFIQKKKAERLAAQQQ